jgi:hypothetical protein
MQNSQWQNNKNVSELAVFGKLEQMGFVVHRRGWPDCVAVRDGEVRFIEVKGPHDSIRQTQVEMAKVFELVGLKYEVWRVAHNGEISS